MRLFTSFCGEVPLAGGRRRPEQRPRDATFAEEDPLVANGWIYAHDPDAALEEDLGATGG